MLFVAVSNSDVSQTCTYTFFFSSIRNSVLNAVPISLDTYRKSKVSSPIPLPGIKSKTSNSSSPEWTLNRTLSNLIRYGLNLLMHSMAFLKNVVPC